METSEISCNIFKNIIQLNEYLYFYIIYILLLRNKIRFLKKNIIQYIIFYIIINLN